jgi:hypothetical protein
MNMTVANYLDFKNLLINEVIGSIWLAYFLILIILIFVAIKFDASIESIFGLSLIYTLLFISIFVSPLIFVLILCLASFLFYTEIISKSVLKNG